MIALAPNAVIDELTRMEKSIKADSLINDANNWWDSNKEPLVRKLEEKNDDVNEDGNSYHL